MAIENCIVHRLEKRADGDESVLIPRTSTLPVTPEMEGLLADLTQSYNSKNGKAYGCFNTESPFSQLLSNTLAGDCDFVAFSLDAMGLLKAQIDQSNFATGGFLLFIQYKQALTDYLMILMLNNTDAVSVDDKLEINSSQYLDLTRLHMAARINISEWKNNTKATRYISFLKPRNNRKVSDYFRDFIGCSETGDSKKETERLLTTFEAYCNEAEFEDEKSEELKRKAFEYCSDQAKNGDSVLIKELSGYLDQDEPDHFARFVNTRDYDVAEEVQPEKSQLQQLVRYSGRAKGLSLSFNAHHLGDTVHYDAASQTLTITNIPDNLKKQLQKRQR
ncbi:nucleoid-associated protein YejK [Aestuariirhabdus litorea]|uniref:Nucleoid-associated protein YejK n=1 Tax=Aestuariirhabdus litorea TaxID=2528527 RepID=A0A3P3VSV9_9GAMM|nr:nucleoid-associated protein YejK [Aestuariirhabdus litorea]RRJ83863.1 nucleoid-associated protein YejK [Aestuariirhabdus litorea]RWW97086.1 nucleoid-associated protein YejK [Endozoicomonadaceae bacterium GTF-13]